MTTSAGIPERIGPYRVLRPIARGGMAEVYEVEDPSNGEHLALKLLLVEGGALKRFNREYEAMIRLNHPNIVRVFHYGFHDKHPWLTMELVEGTPVQAYVKRAGRAGSVKRTREVIRVAHDIALALDHIHFKGLIHRDLKSANVLVLPDGRVKLIDFGTAKVSDPIEQITKDGEFVGTFAYASPEQLQGHEIDHRADLYSFGVLLYRMATGKRPFNAKELHELAKQHVKELPKPPRKLVKALPEALETVILSLLEKKPEHRPQSGQQVAEALEDIAGEPLTLPGTLEMDVSSERLVGREDQVAELRAFMDVGQSASVALIVGPSGSGRQGLMQTVEREVRDRSWRPFTTFFRRGKDDLGPLSTTLLAVGRSLGRDVEDHAATAVEVIDSIARDSTQSAARRREVLRSAGSLLLRERAKKDGKPVAVVLRSLQNAGPVGFDVLVGLREELRDCQPPVLFFADAVETADDPQSLARKRLPDAHRIRLAPLGVREVALLVGSLLHRRPPPTSVARRIHRASGGLPAYVEELVKGMVEGGILKVQGRDVNRIEWAQKEELIIPVPDGAQDRVIAALARLPVDRRRLLEVLAVAGGEANATVLAAGMEAAAEELGPALEDLSDRGWINLEVDDGEKFATWRQILAEAVILDQLHPARRAVIRSLIVDRLLEEQGSAAQILLLTEVGRIEDAVKLGLVWARHHLKTNRPATALEVLDPLVELLEESRDVTRLDKANAYLTHTACLLAARPTDRRLGKSLLKAQQYGRREGNLFNAELELTKARVQRVIGHYPSFERHLLTAWKLIRHEDPNELNATIASQLGWIERMFGQPDEAATWAGRARRIAQACKDKVLLAHVDVVVAGWQYANGMLLECERTAASAVNVFGMANDNRGLSLALPLWVNALRHQGRYSEALKVLYRQLPRMREYEAPTLYVRLLIATGWCEVDLGRLGRAQECVDELGATLRRGEHLHLRLESNLMWARIMLESGQHREALRLLRETEQRARVAGLVVTTEVADAMLGEAYWALGDADTAMEKFLTSVKGLAKAGEIPAALDACISRARAMSDVIDPDELFSPVADFLESRIAVVGRMERQLARLRYAMAHNKRKVPHMLKQCLVQLEQITAQLSDTDRAAMRVHPWGRQLRVASLNMGR